MHQDVPAYLSERFADSSADPFCAAGDKDCRFHPATQAHGAGSSNVSAAACAAPVDFAAQESANRCADNRPGGSIATAIDFASK